MSLAPLPAIPRRLARVRDFVVWAGWCVLLVACGRNESGGTRDKAAGPELSRRSVTPAEISTDFGAGADGRAMENPGEALVADADDAGDESLTSTDPADLPAIVREIDALARRDLRAAGRRSIRALQGLTWADPEPDADSGAEDDGALYLEPGHLPLLRALAEHVFDADHAHGGGMSESIPEEFREMIVGEKVREELRDGRLDETGEWIAGLADRDLAGLAKWELTRALYERDGMPDAFDNYPAALKARSSDVMEAGQRFSVLEAQQASVR